MESDSKKLPTSKPATRSKTLLWIAGSVYGVWLLWLAYVAWVNVSAGNQ